MLILYGRYYHIGKNVTVPSISERDRASAQTLIRLALLEDLGDVGDLTTQAMVPEHQPGEVSIVVRETGIVAGLPIAKMVFEELDHEVTFKNVVEDGSAVTPGTAVAVLSGAAKSLLIGERTALNFLTHLSGIATLTSKFVERAVGTSAKILDTRKTHPGYRLIEKYAVRCGGGVNHRMGLYDGVMIKDNHLAAWEGSQSSDSIADAIRAVREKTPQVPIELEVDTLEQLEQALPGQPDIVLLDNMTLEDMKIAIEMRDRVNAEIQLEASGGITLDTVADIAAVGVDRISVGALTHSAVALDLGFDWGSTFR